MENLDIITLFSDYKQVCLQRIRQTDDTEVCIQLSCFSVKNVCLCQQFVGFLVD